MIGGVWRNVRSVLKSYSGRCRFTKICYNDDEEENQPRMDSAFERILREQGVS